MFLKYASNMIDNLIDELFISSYLCNNKEDSEYLIIIATRAENLKKKLLKAKVEEVRGEDKDRNV